MTGNKKNVRDPRLLISPPFVECPKCGKEAFGVVGIYRHCYSRRCRECLHPDGNDPHRSTFHLPRLAKKLIYLDQCCISNMMKALHPDTRRKVDLYWVELFSKLDRLSKLQLIVCPSSGMHQQESLLSPFFQALQRMYKHFSHNVDFHGHETIKRFQLQAHLKNWLIGKKEQPVDLDVSRVLSGSLTTWNSRFVVSVNRSFDPSMIEEMRKQRDATHEAIAAVFERWREEGHRAFWDWHEEETLAFGRNAEGSYFGNVRLLKGILTGELSFEAALSSKWPNTLSLATAIQQMMVGAGVPPKIVPQESRRFFLCPSLRRVPFNRISGFLWAAIARKAAHGGMKRPPNQGMVSDICVISTLLPYCDAMFIDNECRGYLNEQPICKEMDYDTKLFSNNNRAEFMSYLDGVERAMPGEHLEKIREVYGDSWETPFLTMYQSR